KRRATHFAERSALRHGRMGTGLDGEQDGQHQPWSCERNERGGHTRDPLAERTGKRAEKPAGAQCQQKDGGKKSKDPLGKRSLEIGKTDDSEKTGRNPGAG